MDYIIEGIKEAINFILNTVLPKVQDCFDTLDEFKSNCIKEILNLLNIETTINYLSILKTSFKYIRLAIIIIIIISAIIKIVRMKKRRI